MRYNGEEGEIGEGNKEHKSRREGNSRRDRICPVKDISDGHAADVSGGKVGVPLTVLLSTGTSSGVPTRHFAAAACSWPHWLDTAELVRHPLHELE